MWRTGVGRWVPGPMRLGMRKLFATLALIASAGIVLSLSACNDKKTVVTPNPTPTTTWFESVLPSPSAAVSIKSSPSDSVSDSASADPDEVGPDEASPEASLVLHLHP